MSLFDFSSVGKETVQKATDNLAPLLRDVENRAGGILHGLLDRLNGMELTIKVSIPPIPKAEKANE